MSQAANTKLVKSLAKQFGFDYCGIAAAKELTEDARRLEQWLSNGYHGEMQYMENHFDLRVDPRKLVPGAKSVITFLINYYPAQQDQIMQIDSDAKIAKYAWGEDYHEVIRTKLQILLSEMQKHMGNINGRGFVDSAPVLERSWAQLSGAGWIGKNGNLIRPQTGSFFFLATLIVDIELDNDTPIPNDYCGTCTKCIDACPTEAILPNKTIQANHCISYYTIELKQSEINTHKNYTDWAFGCDICQDVCPWNRFSKKQNENAFEPHPEFLNLSSGEWENMNQETFQYLFGKSAIKRTKFEGIKRNVGFLKKPS